MKNFKDFEYVRPNMKEFEEKITASLTELKGARDYKDALVAYNKIEALFSAFDTMFELAGVRNAIDLNDKFYDTEWEWFADEEPNIKDYRDKFNKVLVASPYKGDFVKDLGSHLFEKIEMDMKVFSPDILEDLKEENAIQIEYDKLIGNAKVNYKGEEKTLSQLSPYMQDRDRSIRKESHDLYYGYMSDNLDKLDDIYDRLVKVRDRIAKKLGFDNFIEVAYLRLHRSDYKPEDIRVFREEIKKYLVPISNKLREKQAKRVGLSKLEGHDISFQFPSGNPKPKGDTEWIIDEGKKMYDELSPETSKFFRMLIDRGLADLEAKKGKLPGGFCTFLEDYKVPFVFSNFNGTQDDIEVLTHEVGHAFQTYLSRDLEPSYRWPTFEAAEIHSTAMEYLTYPWMDRFFKEDTEKFIYSHLQQAILFIPYGASIDEFQHYVYANPSATPAERRAKWREIEKTYMPYKNYNLNYLEEGGYWQRQLHVYIDPFYYIDYTLADISALELYKLYTEDKGKAWDTYVDLCKLGGSKPFLALVEAAKLTSPFKSGLMGDLMEFVQNQLDNIDDKNF